ncbi:hypothetical protein WDU94_008169 [Cyamophila willieti]
MACALAENAVLPGGYLADTPDVAAAKIAHFEEKAKAAAAAGTAPDYVTAYYLNYYKSFGQNNAPAAITVLPSGYLADTPEVSAAKAAHLAEVAKASYAATPIAVSPTYNNDYYRYASPYASPYAYTPAQITVLPNGYLADTPEVAAAKASHSAEYAKAFYAATPIAASPVYNNDYYRYASPYAYTPSQITVLPNGYLADTPEVAAAKAVHFKELARASISSS